MSDPSTPQPFRSWAIVEQMGHRRIAGLVTADAPLLHATRLVIEVYDGAGAEPAATIGTGYPVYQLTACTEELARSPRADARAGAGVRPGRRIVTVRDDFERALREMLEFACCEPEADDMAAVLAAADEYRASGLRSLADDLDADARALEALNGERPWPSMLDGIRVHDSRGGAGLLRRAARMARERASAAPGAPAGTTPVSLDGPEPQNRPQGREEAGP